MDGEIIITFVDGNAYRTTTIDKILEKTERAIVFQKADSDEVLEVLMANVASIVYPDLESYKSVQSLQNT